MSRRAVCARLEARSLPCCCRRRAALCPRARASRFVEPARRLELRLEVVLADPRRCSRSRPGPSSSTSWWTFRRAARTVRAVSRRLPPQQQVLRGPGGLPIARRQPARRPVSAGYAELTAQLRQAARRSRPTDPIHEPAAGRPTLKSLTAVDRALLRASAVEVNKLEQRMPFLATTASIAPFIGLFGTVWGIMIAFRAIGADRVDEPRRSSAPGIAEALIATAAGLAAAIPAVCFYNHLTQPREAVRVGDGRLRDGVPEHRREELHVDAESPGHDAGAASGRGGPRPPRRHARSPRSTSSRSST